MNVLLLTDCGLTWNEAPPSRLLCLGREIARDGHAVRVVGSHTDLAPQVQGVQVIPLPFRADGGLRQALFPLHAAIREQVRWCDAVIVRGYWIGFWAFWYALALGRKLRFYDYHGLNAREQWFDRRRLRALSTWLVEQTNLALATHIVAASHFLRKRLSGPHRRKSCLLENGVDMASFAPRQDAPDAADIVRGLTMQPGRPVFTMVAHFGSWLEPDVVIRAAGRLREEIELLVVGDGSVLVAARAEQQRLGLTNVHFAGQLPHREVQVVLRSVTYACICPYNAVWLYAQEPGFFSSRKIREYLAAGHPVVCSDVAGRGDLLRQGETCLLYRPGDDEDLARRMRELTEQPDLARKLGTRGRELVGQFAWESLYRSSGLAVVLRSRSP